MIAKTIKKRIQSLGIADVAKRSGVSYAVLHRFMSGERNNLRLDTIEKLLPVLKLTIERKSIRSELTAAKQEMSRAVELLRKYCSRVDESQSDAFIETSELWRSLRAIQVVLNRIRYSPKS